MYSDSYVFAQIMERLPRRDFDKCVDRYGGERYAKVFSCREQFLAMAFGQLAYRESLRDIVACLSSHRSKLYHLGFGTLVSFSALARANERRDWRIWRDLALVLIGEARALYMDEPAIADDIAGACYAIDSTSIELCLALFPWFPYVSTKGAVKLHLGLDIRGSIPAFFDMTAGRVNDVNYLDQVIFESGSFYIMDRGYVDFGRLHTIHQKGAYFVTRAKHNTRLHRRYSNPVDRRTGVICDQIVFLTGEETSEKYPDTLRRIKYRDVATGHVYVFLTNNLSASAASIALLYKNRWQIELFFKWIKQNLKIKTFLGTCKNAVMSQVWVAMIYYLLVSYIKFQTRYSGSLLRLTWLLKETLLARRPLIDILSLNLKTATKLTENEVFQPVLF